MALLGRIQELSTPAQKEEGRELRARSHTCQEGDAEHSSEHCKEKGPDLLPGEQPKPSNRKHQRMTRSRAESRQVSRLHHAHQLQPYDTFCP